MKKIIALIAGVLMMTGTAFASQNTLFSGDVEHGGFGGPIVKWSKINEKDALLVGGRGGWIINHTVAIGGSGCGLANEITTTLKNADGTIIKNSDGSAKEVALQLGYGGVFIQMIGLSDEVIHFNLDCTAGAGNVTYREKNNNLLSDKFEGDQFFVVEPELDLVFNIAEFFRISAGGGYRFVYGANLGEFNDKNLSGPTAKVAFNFGMF